MARSLRLTCRWSDSIDCWRIVWSFVDTSAVSALRLANLESLRGRSGTRPCTAGVEFDGPDSIEPSAETFWPPHDLVFPTNRSPRCRRGCRPHGTDTPTGRRPERRFRPYAR